MVPYTDNMDVTGSADVPAIRTGRAVNASASFEGSRLLEAESPSLHPDANADTGAQGAMASSHNTSTSNSSQSSPNSARSNSGQHGHAANHLGSTPASRGTAQISNTVASHDATDTWTSAATDAARRSRLPVRIGSRSKGRTKEPRRFVCEYCNTKFTRTSSLKRHVEAIHDDARPYKCRFACGYDTNQRSNLRRHEAIHEENGDVDPRAPRSTSREARPSAHPPSSTSVSGSSAMPKIMDPLVMAANAAYSTFARPVSAVPISMASSAYEAASPARHTSDTSNNVLAAGMQPSYQQMWPAGSFEAVYPSQLGPSSLQMPGMSQTHPQQLAAAGWQAALMAGQAGGMFPMHSIPLGPQGAAHMYGWAQHMQALPYGIAPSVSAMPASPRQQQPRQQQQRVFPQPPEHVASLLGRQQPPQYGFQDRQEDQSSQRLPASYVDFQPALGMPSNATLQNPALAAMEAAPPGPNPQRSA